jgi:uncharacterized membrane protein
MNRLPSWGRCLLALPMLVFPVFHFVDTSFVAALVPPWIPGRVYWTWFTGATIFAAGLAILFRKQLRLAATLLGVEILLFCLLIHGPILFRPDNAWVREIAGKEDLPARLNNAFKDLGMSGALFILAGGASNRWLSTRRDPLLDVGRAIFALCVAAFGVLHFVYPGFAPGIQPMYRTVAFPLPWGATWGFLTGAFFIVAAAAIAADRQAREAALWLGVVILAFDLLNWCPQFVANPGALAGNWLKDLGVAGGAWILADALAKAPARAI